MKNFRFSLLLLFLLITFQVFPQDQVKVDSLKKLLRKAKNDTVEVDVLNQLFEEYIRNDTAIAKDFANQSLKLSKESDYPRGIAEYYYQLANLNIAQGNFRQARNNFQRSIDLYKDIGDKKLMGRGYFAMGYCLYNLQDYRLSLEYHLESLKTREEIRDTSGLIKSYQYLGHVYNRRGDYPRALDYNHKLLDIYESTDNRKGLAECLNSIGWNFSNQGDYSQALDYHQNALKTFEELGDSNQIATTFNYIGIIFYNLSDYPLSIEYFLKSLKIRQALGDSTTIADCLNNIGLIYQNQGDYPMALDYYLRTLHYREKLGEKSRLGICYLNIGNVYYYMKDTIHALNYYQNALAIHTELNEKGRMASCYISLGNVNFNKMEYPRALENYRNALDIFVESVDKNSIAVCLLNIGNVYFWEANYPLALENFNEALKIAEEIGSGRRTALLYVHLGKVYFKMGEYQKAIRNSLKGYELGSNLEVKEAMRDASQTLAESYAATGVYRKAFDYHVLFKTMSDSLLNAANIRDITTKENQYQFEKEKQVIELENLKREELYAAEFKEQQILRNAFIGAFILMIIIAALIFWSYRQKQKANILLQKKNVFISQQKEEIEAQKDEIELKKEELQITLDHLQETQGQLIQSEKLAALGGLVAGVAHEINTPVGIGVTAVSSLLEDTRHMADLYKKEQLNRKDFKEFLQTTNNSARLVQKNLERTAQLIQSFKQVSADQSTEEQREFLFKGYLEDVIRSLYPKFKNRNIQMNIDCDEKLKLNSYPGVFAQIFTNLVLNSLTHGFTDEMDGQIDIAVNKKDKNINIEYKDNGKGIPEDILPKIFDPFITIDQSKGTGLGLHIVYNIVTQKLNGSLECDSKLNNGVLFQIIFPYTV